MELVLEHLDYCLIPATTVLVSIGLYASMRALVEVNCYLGMGRVRISYDGVPDGIRALSHLVYWQEFFSHALSGKIESSHDLRHGFILNYFCI